MVFRKVVVRDKLTSKHLVKVFCQENIVTGRRPHPHLAYSLMVGEARRGGWGGVGGALVMMQGPQRWTEFREITDIYSFRAWSQMFVCRMSPPPLPVCQVVVVVLGGGGVTEMLQVF